ncbi:MAG: hypothetical protein AABY64_00180 [Bdellovibrionota bacterium]
MLKLLFVLTVFALLTLKGNASNSELRSSGTTKIALGAKVFVATIEEPTAVKLISAEHWTCKQKFYQVEIFYDEGGCANETGDRVVVQKIETQRDNSVDFRVTLVIPGSDQVCPFGEPRSTSQIVGAVCLASEANEKYALTELERKNNPEIFGEE